MLELPSNRLLLRGMLPDDAEAVFSYRSDKMANKYQGWIPVTIDDVTDFIEYRVSPVINVVDTWYQFVIIKKGTNTIIGDIGVHFVDQEQSQVELGCTISQEFQQRRFATNMTNNLTIPLAVCQVLIQVVF